MVGSWLWLRLHPSLLVLTRDKGIRGQIHAALMTGQSHCNHIGPELYYFELGKLTALGDRLPHGEGMYVCWWWWYYSSFLYLYGRHHRGGWAYRSKRYSLRPRQSRERVTDLDPLATPRSSHIHPSRYRVVSGPLCHYDHHLLQ